jgi:hypothetical protein
MATSQLDHPALGDQPPPMGTYLPLVRRDFTNALEAFTDGLAHWAVEMIVFDLAPRVEGSIEGVSFDDDFKGKRLWDVFSSDFTFSSRESLVRELRDLGPRGEKLFADKVTEELVFRGHLKTQGLQCSFDHPVDMVFGAVIK